jgi:hypothetical protein
MAQEENKKLHGRAELKKFFRNGQVPTENHFANLIDSAIIKLDDGISKDEENGQIIAPIGPSQRLITFFKNMDHLEPFFYIEKDIQESPSLKFQPGIAADSPRDEEETSFYFHQDGRMGIGKRSQPNIKLDINGFTASKGRIGTFRNGKVPADGKWHPIAEGLDNCQALEIVARTGKKGSGKFSILHAIALSTFGLSNCKIRKTCAYYGLFWNKLNLRWRGDTHNYSLELRTNSNFGNSADIYYHIGQLWDDGLFLPEEDYYAHTDKQVYR